MEVTSTRAMRSRTVLRVVGAGTLIVFAVPVGLVILGAGFQFKFLTPGSWLAGRLPLYQWFGWGGALLTAGIVNFVSLLALMYGLFFVVTRIRRKAGD